MRRFATHSGHSNESSHLDADEMTAFAEGALPEVARAQYVSHLADCDRCRKQVSSLALAAGAVARAEQSLADNGERRNVWQMLAGLFALPVLRYAAFGALLLIVAGVAFIALRRPAEQRALVAADEPMRTERGTAVKPSDDTNGSLNKEPATARSASASPSPASANQDLKRDEGRVADNTTPPLQTMKEAARPAEDSAKKAEESTVTETKSGYAPAPPGETQSGARVQSGTGGVITMSDSRKATDKPASGERERNIAKDADRVDDASRTSSQPTFSMSRATEEKVKGPSRNMNNAPANAQSANELRAEPPKTVGGVASTAESPQMLSVGGHKFRRQGNSWIDQKFKSSMTLKIVSRNSDEFAALNSGVRSIAQQLSGEVIVVSKGKAYLIK